jgi:hypothetical protein
MPVMHTAWPALTELWSEAIDVHDHLPLTRSAALAALKVGSEDRRRSHMGIPSIFEPPPPTPLRRGAP